MSTTQAVQIISISTALFASGGIASLSAFDIPLLRSQPASRSLPMLRWLFSRGSHTAPTAILISSAGFLYLAYSALPALDGTWSGAITHVLSGRTGVFLAASALSFSCAVFTSVAMLATNFELIARNENLGGSRSAASMAYRERIDAQPRSAEASVDAKQDVSQWTDLSDPQEETKLHSTREQDEEVKMLLTVFQKRNHVRAGLIGAGGIVGLIGALN